ncbi:hypothetical protein A3H89_01405 [Candidatus Amesbacteria bacterium RIFCSPLOWO2_02_FULL_48_11]|uniref:DUF7282 domain-containing protein n=4 Tax=Candidatus Amesiibacteriota TaxID=1752730 RepID=A0A1F4ZF03_9BACT|nr:MAG: hypothetical protein UX78_C0019G0011 [Candidatus Amesbacteria bacterium GW2011_GWA2_47_11]KKU93830.1 MAG: hypothetical protein UY22_C0016G0015 [Candidatus Amesbacteria bacterium GW2011_GWC1_48_10]KKU99633.1 MAG: hypothetical protein UY33_C0026G0011 [Candidatus Amesbacteria bacterium GW2011_GWA1_48_9]OGC90144.1 MAG: hypothetical protein A2V48_01065 [Candidatus Amesbacteria bacterium RBG_19FT_COMBO_48_16]OGC96437.1 MAG: hypothetical protein A3C34_02975 [Candidatus Amesbacteria bacterium R
MELRGKMLWILPMAVTAVISAGGGLWLAGRSNRAGETVSPVEESPAGKAATGMPAVTSSLYVEDQFPAGFVMVERVRLVKPGYVAVHQVDEDGNPGRVLGVSGLVSGEKRDVRVNLIEAGKEGEELAAMLHIDDGDGQFSFPGPDGPARDNYGREVMQIFEILGVTPAPGLEEITD